MENELFLNAGIIPAAAIPIWPSAMEIQATNEMNCSSELSSDCFFNPNNNWEKSTDHSLQFDSALSSMVSSPVASNSNMSNSGESFVIRELIGKLGNIGTSSGEISPHALPPPYIINNHHSNDNNSATNTSCYTTPLNSPPKPNLGNSMALNSSSVAEFSADPGFAERAAKFSRFGSRSFNCRGASLFVPNNNIEFGGLRSNNPTMPSEKLPRVSSSPSLKEVLGSQGNKNSSSPLQYYRSELPNSSQEESSVSEQIPNGDSALKTSNEFNSRKRKAVPKGKGKESAKVAEANENSNNKRSKSNEGNANENGAVKAEDEPKIEGDDDQQAKAKANTKPPEPPKDYIHVRARRGQATDSHSLAERVRREKISERMKFLQDLVPGCNKLTGKAIMLDEIINYVQSLQRQVEFLSMKLASVNTRLEFNVDALMSKEMYQPNKPLTTHSIYPVDSSASSSFFGHQPQQNPAPHSNFSDGTMTQCPMDPLDNQLCRNINMQLPLLHQFTETIPQFSNFCEDDLQSIVQNGFCTKSEL